MKTAVFALLLCSVLATTGCTTREVAAGAVGAGAGYVIGKNHD